MAVRDPPATSLPTARVALVIAGCYAGLGALWALFSGRILPAVVSDPERLDRLLGLNHWLFVTGSALALYIVAQTVLGRTRRLEQRARESERVLASLVSHLPGLAYRCRHDRDWTMEWVSDSCRELTGYAPHDIVHNRRISYGSLIHEDDRHAVWDAVHAAVAADTVYQLTYRLRPALGPLKWVSEQGRAILDRVAGTHLLEGLVIDITAQKRVEEQLRQAQKLEEIGQLTGGICHDLNNVLSVILTNTQFLQAQTGVGDEVQDGLHDIEYAGQSAARLIRQLMAFARRADLNLQPVNLRHVVTDAAGLLDRLLPDNVHVRLLDEGEAATARADAGAIQQILMNLATNARDAMPGGGELTIDVAAVEIAEEDLPLGTSARPGRYVRLAVADTGQGMDPETRTHLFEPFYTTKEPGRGTGLGMAIVYGLVQQHGGIIRVDSEPGRGTSILIDLPAARPAAPGAAPAKRAVDTGRMRGTETILLVEDDEALRRTAQRVLERSGYTVLPAADGEEALACFRQRARDIDLVLTDVVMPNLDGLELHRELERAGNRAPVLFVSGHPPSELRTQGRLGPDVPILQKPWTLAAILRKVRETLDGRAA